MRKIEMDDPTTISRIGPITGIQKFGNAIYYFTVDGVYVWRMDNWYQRLWKRLKAWLKPKED